MVYVINGVKI